jgi:hypothetical protein
MQHFGTLFAGRMYRVMDGRISARIRNSVISVFMLLDVGTNQIIAKESRNDRRRVYYNPWVATGFLVLPTGIYYLIDMGW